MVTGIYDDGVYRLLLKGAPEKVIEKCNISSSLKLKVLEDIKKRQEKAERVLCFAHKDLEGKDFSDNEKGYVFDGYAVITDPVRPEVKKAVLDCKRAGISIKMLTGDNQTTAYAIAKQLGIVKDETQVVNASFLQSSKADTPSEGLLVAESIDTSKLARYLQPKKAYGLISVNDAERVTD